MFDLKSRRRELKLSQDDIAEAIGVSRGTVSKWESGYIANMKRDKIAKIANLLHISPLTVLEINDNSITPPSIIMNFPETIKRLRKERNMTQADLARLSHVAPTTVSAWERGASYPLMTTTKLLANIFSVPISVIAGENDSSTYDSSLSHHYPYLDAGVSCGAPALVDSYTNNDLQRIQLSDAVMGRYAGDKDILIIHANGESMNRIFPSGALLAVKRTSDLSNGDIVVFSINDEEFSCKRYYKNDKAKVISFQPDSDDSSFEPYVYRYEDASDVTIFGKVVVYTVVL